MKARDRIGERVAKIRSARGWSQRELAERMSAAETWNQVGIARVEGGQRRLTVDSLLTLAKVLNTSPTNLLTPPDPNETITIGAETFEAGPVRDWIRGFAPLPGADEAEFYESAPFYDRVIVTDPSLKAFLAVVEGMAEARVSGDKDRWQTLVEAHDQVVEMKVFDETTGEPYYLDGDEVVEMIKEIFDRMSSGHRDALLTALAHQHEALVRSEAERMRQFLKEIS